MIEIEIGGVITCDVSQDEFFDMFTEWLEAKGWSFGGGGILIEDKG